MDAPLAMPMTLADVSGDGLLLDRGGWQEAVAWFQVEDIAVGTMSGAAGSAFTMAMELADGRMIVASEREPVWRFLIEALPVGLPGVVPYSEWSAALIGSPPAVIVIFSRPPVGHA